MTQSVDTWSHSQRPFCGWMKGMPDFPGTANSADIASLHINLLSGRVSLPCAVIKESTLRRNENWMLEFTRQSGIGLAPHGKTTMSPELFARQLASGAWGITAATPHQLRMMRRWGIQRILYANQLVDPSALRYVAQELEADPGFEFYCLVDSLSTIDILSTAMRGASRSLNVLLELGQDGGRTGVRTMAAATGLAQAIRERENLALAGLETFEFTIAGSDVTSRERNMARLFDDFVAVAETLDRSGYFTNEQIILTAGGSAYFDLAAKAMTSAHLSRPVVPVIRSGCYLTSDEGWLPGFIERMRARSAIAEAIPTRPAGAIEVWGYIQSRPERTLAFATLGKRDVSYDMNLPEPVSWFRPGLHGRPVPLDRDTRIEALNDQHAYLRVPADSPLEVGDMIAVGISHPCTTFDKWRAMLLVDDAYAVVGAISTWF